MSTFLALALIHFLALISPGPDFIMITRQSLSYSKRAGVLTAAGLGCGMFLHVTYCLLGIGIVISKSILLYNAIKWLGALYLFWIGLQALFSRRKNEGAIEIENLTRAQKSSWAHWRVGFLTNALNPKATIFVLAVFTQFIDPSTPFLIQSLYGAYMATSTFLWFAFVANLFSLTMIQNAYLKARGVIEKTMGAILITLSMKLALSSRE